jgi:hypothetical protein
METLCSTSPLTQPNLLTLAVKEQLLLLEEADKIILLHTCPYEITHNERADIARKESVYIGTDS